MLKSYTIDELKVGMVVKRSQLRNIYGTWIFFDNYDPSEGGRIICISDVQYCNKTMQAVKDNGGLISTFYSIQISITMRWYFMSRNYIISKSVHNEFFIDFSCEFMGVPIQYEAKLDTGAVLSLLPLCSVTFMNHTGLHSNEVDIAYSVLKNSLLDGGDYIRMRSASSFGDVSFDPASSKETVFLRDIFDLFLGEVFVGADFRVGVSCDTIGSVLIGMDILKQFNFHCGVSQLESADDEIMKGDYLLIGCLKSQINEEYLNI